MLDLSNYTAGKIGNTGMFENASGNNFITYNGKNIILIMSNSSALTIIDYEYRSASSDDNLRYIGTIPGGNDTINGCFKIKLKSTAIGHKIQVSGIGSTVAEQFKGVYYEN